MRSVASLALLAALLLPGMASALELSSPDGRIVLDFRLTAAGEPQYRVSRDGTVVLETSRLGLVRADADFSANLEFVTASDPVRVQDDYELLVGKRRRNHYEANASTAHLQLTTGARLDIEFRVSDDGIAFRYVFPERSATVHRIVREATTFRLPGDARAWLQPLAPAKSGWSATNPSYEEYYLRDIEPGTVSPFGGDWVFPALFRTGEHWLLVSESNLGRDYCGSRLASTWRSPEYGIAFPGPLEHFADGPVRPAGTLPWTTPWRLVVIGSLATVVESTLGTDLAAAPPAGADADPGAPGKASWSWPLLKDDETIPSTQRAFIDYAAAMQWQYTLIDALWDKQIGYDALAELVAYARERGVKILVWYNSAGDWNSTPLTPRDRLLTHAARVAEMSRLRDIGVAGIKVDFFGGDGQSVIGYYQDILDDARSFGLLVNFHGATLPRGWQRTYPNLMTMEAVRGLEFVTFEQRNADEEPRHAAMLPFTRNVFDPMDYTPLVLDRIPNIERRTSAAFQLALAVLYTSGIQHYAEVPAGMAKAPDYVRDFLRTVPSVWDDVAFVAGDPGNYAVVARKAADRWYVAGINGGDAPRRVSVDTARFGNGYLIRDGDDALGFAFERVSGSSSEITMPVRGGFVAVLGGDD